MKIRLNLIALDLIVRLITNSIKSYAATMRNKTASEYAVHENLFPQLRKSTMAFN